MFVFCDGPLPPTHEAVLAKYMAPVSGDVVIRSAVSEGLPSALNALIDRALLDTDVEVLARMDADDLSMPTRLSRQIAFLQEHPTVDVVGTWCIEFEEPDKPLFHKRLPTEHDEVLDFMVCRSPLAHPTVMFRRGVFDAGHRYDTRLQQMQDYELWSRLVRTGIVISNVPEYLLWYRMADGFFKRRSGLGRAIKEIHMRIVFASAMKLLRPVHLFKLAALFLARIVPERLKHFAYMRMR